MLFLLCRSWPVCPYRIESVLIIDKERVHKAKSHDVGHYMSKLKNIGFHVLPDLLPLYLDMLSVLFSVNGNKVDLVQVLQAFPGRLS